MSELQTIPAAITWPTIRAGKRTFTLRYSYTSDYLLAKYGVNLASADAIQLAAAMAGEFVPSGEWRSEGFARPIDLADLMSPEDSTPLIEAVGQAVKNRFPELDLKTAPVRETTEPTEKNDSSDSGPSQPVLTASDSATDASGS